MTGPATVVSGATGFLGLALVRHLAERGHRVRGLARSPRDQPEIEGVTWFACTLPGELDESALDGAEVLVHLAYDTRFSTPKQAQSVNVGSSRWLFDAARAGGVERIVFVSSMSAHGKAESFYGRSKLDVEALLDPEKDVALRPGHIVGPGGVFWRQAEQIARLPFIPLFFGGRQELQTVAREDVCEVLRVLAEGDLTGVLAFAEVEPVTLRSFYGAIARALGKRPRFLRLPGPLALWALLAAERIGFRLPLSSDNLLGLKRLRAFDVAADVERVGVRPRTMQESLVGVPWEKLARR